MKKLILTTLATAVTVAMLSAPSVADTAADDTPKYSKVSVNRAAKTDLAPAGFKAYQSRTSIKAFDTRYKERGQGMADKR